MSRRKLSVGWLAKETGCDRNNLRKLLNGKRRDGRQSERCRIGIDLLYRISRVMNYDFFLCCSQCLPDMKRGKNDLIAKKLKKIRQIPVGEHIKRTVKAKGLSQAAFGKMIGRSREAVRYIFRQNSINTELLAIVSEVLEYNFFQLYTFEDKTGTGENG